MRLDVGAQKLAVCKQIEDFVLGTMYMESFIFLYFEAFHQLLGQSIGYRDQTQLPYFQLLSCKLAIKNAPTCSKHFFGSSIARCAFVRRYLSRYGVTLLLVQDLNQILR